MRLFSSSLAVLLTIATLQAQPVNPEWFAGLRWRSIGPPRSGYVSSPAGVPGDPTTYYVGMPEGGVWKTTNGGTTWKPIFDEVHVAVDRRRRRRALRSERRLRRHRQPVRLVVHDRQGRLQVDRRRPDLDEHRSARLALHRRHRRRSAQRRTTCSSPRSDRVRPARGRRTRRRRRTAAGRRARRVSNDRRRPLVDARAASRRLVGRVRRSSRLRRSADRLCAARRPAARARQPRGTGAYKSTDGGATWQPVGGRGLPDGARISAFAVSSGTHGRRLYAVAAVGGGRGAGGAATARCIDRTTAARAGRSARASWPAPAGRSTRIRRTPTSCI